MHPTAMANGKRFFDVYAAGRGALTVVDVGAQDVNGSLREVMPPECKYIGVDFLKAKGVDIVLTDPYQLPFEDGSVDIVVCSSCLEHSEMFWLIFLEMLRILKPTGLCYLNVPSNSTFHRFPVDCWRFYPDSGRALVTWAKRSGVNAALMESYTSRQWRDTWNDFVAVFVKEEASAGLFPRRIIDSFSDFDNGFVYGSEQMLHEHEAPEDLRRLESKRWLLSRLYHLIRAEWSRP
jgi:SAM-dependent methyltransferase